MSTGRFFALARRLTSMDGALAARVEADKERSKADEGSSAQDIASEHGDLFEVREV